MVQLARRSGLTALALTDHDTVGGVAEAAAEAGQLGLAFLPGIEISAEIPAPGTLHILGYGVDPASPALVEMTRQLIEGRDNRNPRMVAKLNELGVDVTMAEWEAEANGGVLGRPHLAADSASARGTRPASRTRSTSTSAKGRPPTPTRNGSPRPGPWR